MDFIASASGPEPSQDKAYYFIFDSRHIVLENNTIPRMEETRAKDLFPGRPFYLGRFQNLPCYCAALASKDLPEPYSRTPFRKFFHGSNDDFRMMAGFARQILDLHLNFRYCGKCGSPTRPLSGEHARHCPACGLDIYPRISPAIITAVTRGDEILLARGINFPDKKMFSVLAGFVSPAETLETCVQREVYEETRIRVNGVRYVKSQPWPFPDSLMIGFTARYESGDIRIDPNEIAEAAWFKADCLPRIPDAYTLSGQLIRDFVRKQKA